MATAPAIAADILTRLADIVEPPPVADWPPAPGWIFVAVLMTLALILLLFHRWQRWRGNAYRRAALSALRGLSPVAPEHLPAILELLRRCALAAYPREAIAPLSRHDWLQFLERSAGLEVPKSCHRLLCDGAYLPPDACRQIPAQDLLLLHKFVGEWIHRHRHVKAFGPGHTPTTQPGSAHGL